MNNSSDDIERVREAAYRLYDSFEKDSQQEGSYDGLVVFSLMRIFLHVYIRVH